MNSIYQKPVAPQWASRVSKEIIARIYEDDARGLHDEELLNNAAFTLLLRCESMLIAEKARSGYATCPVCGQIIEHDAQKDTILECTHCSWSGTWEEYRKSMDGHHLIAPGILPFCEEYIKHIKMNLTAKESMYWIDWLIHRVHWEGTALPGQPGAVCLIQGRAIDINEFLDRLSAGTHRTPPDNLSSLWDEDKKQQIKKWRRAAENRRRKRK